MSSIKIEISEIDYTSTSSAVPPMTITLNVEDLCTVTELEGLFHLIAQNLGFFYIKRVECVKEEESYEPASDVD